jgi:hypothetical protein
MAHNCKGILASGQYKGQTCRDIVKKCTKCGNVGCSSANKDCPNKLTQSGGLSKCCGRRVEVL